MNADTPKHLQGRFLISLFRREVGAVLFTEGKHREYEYIMQETPGFDRRPAITRKERDCKHCLYYDEKSRKCNKARCLVFGD